MSVSLPGHPDLDQLRRQAKELRNAARLGDQRAAARIAGQLSPRPGESVTLALAQLVIAREHGFTSWPNLKAAVDAAGEDSRRQLAEFLTASVEGRTELAVALLDADPSIGRADIFTAAVTGDAERVAELIADAPARALKIDDERGWPPLLYACYTHWHRIDPRRAPGTAAVARLLLDAGASPDTNNGGRPNYDYRSALYGAVTSNNPGITRLLLERGAEPDDRVSLTGAAGWRDHECLRLLLDHGAGVARTWALGAAVWADDDEAVRLLLDAASRTEPAARVAELADQVLPDAAQRGSVAVVETLLTFGADPNSATSEGPPLLRAVRAGRLEVASVLTNHGASNAVSSIDRFLGACARADRAEAERLLAEYPGLPGELSDTDRATIVEAATQDGTAAVSLMLDLGYPVDARNDLGETALHAAAYEGRAATVRLLIDHGADVGARDSRFDSTPLAFATVGSGEHPSASGDWAATVRILLDAGAGREGVWITDKPPSLQVADVLRAYGVEENADENEDETRVDDEPEESGEPSSPGDELLREIAEHLRVAYDTADLELFASLLHPEVHWGGGPEGCTNRAQVLAWYQNELRRGARAQVTAAEVQSDAIVVGLAVARPAVGARPIPPDVIYQLLRVSDGLIVSITGFEDLSAARAAAATQPGAT
jgi:ankyrin repeat protein